MKGRQIAGWFFVPYIMIFLKWKRLSRPKRVWGTVWALWAVFCIVIVIASGASTPTEPPKPPVTASTPPSKPVTASPSHATTPKQPVKPAPTAPSTETIISEAVHSALNGEVRGTKQLESVDVNAYAGDDAAGKGKYLVLVHMVAEEGFSTDQAMQMTVNDIKRVSHKLFGSSTAVYDAEFYVDTQLKDQYGNVSTGQWCRMILNGSDGYKINYDNLSDGEFAKLLQFNGWTNDSRSAYDNLVKS